MSSRFYPRYVAGNPQLRVFLPDWPMILIRPKQKTEANVVTFKVDPRMTNWDVRNYLDKIYNIKVGGIKSIIRAGDLKLVGPAKKPFMSKKDDYRIVWVTLKLGETFTFPDLYPKEAFQQEMADYKNAQEAAKKDLKRDTTKQDVPNWFL